MGWREASRSALLPAAALLLAGAWASASSVRPLSLEELTGQSALVVRGTVIDSRSYRDPDRGWILTDTRIRVLEAFRGRSGPVVTVTEMGGVAGGVGMIASGTPRFEPGEEVVVFLREAGGRWRTSGLAQGKFTVQLRSGVPVAVSGGSPAADSRALPLAELGSRVRRAAGAPQVVR